MVTEMRNLKKRRNKMMSKDTNLIKPPRVHVAANWRKHAVPQEAA